MLILYYFDFRFLRIKVYGEIAQLARASGSYPGGRGSESPSRYQIDNYSDTTSEFFNV